MKNLKMLITVAVTATALMAVVGASTASATVLCKNNLSTTACSERYAEGTEVQLTNGGTETLTTSFKNIECAESTFHGKVVVAIGTAVSIVLSFFRRRSCNCEVNTLKNGSISITHISGTDNGTLTSSGEELTAACSTIFGTVHCIYATNATDLGTLTGGNPAKLDVSSADVPRLTTNALCDESANRDATYNVVSPTPLFVAS